MRALHLFPVYCSCVLQYTAFCALLLCFLSRSCIPVGLMRLPRMRLITLLLLSSFLSFMFCWVRSAALRVHALSCGSTVSWPYASSCQPGRPAAGFSLRYVLALSWSVHVGRPLRPWCFPGWRGQTSCSGVDDAPAMLLALMAYYRSFVAVRLHAAWSIRLRVQLAPRCEPFPGICH